MRQRRTRGAAVAGIVEAECRRRVATRPPTVVAEAGTTAIDGSVRVTMDATTIRRSRRLAQQRSGAVVMAGCGRGIGYMSTVQRGGDSGLGAGYW